MKNKVSVTENRHKPETEINRLKPDMGNDISEKDLTLEV
jgi:hypothetical protein